MRKVIVLVNTLTEFKDDILAKQDSPTLLILRYNRRIVEELVKHADQQQLAEYLGLKYPDDTDYLEPKTS